MKRIIIALIALTLLTITLLSCNRLPEGRLTSGYDTCLPKHTVLDIPDLKNVADIQDKAPDTLLAIREGDTVYIYYK